MKNLLLMRHAKSSWKNADLPDHERPLNARGRRAAALMGGFLSERNLRPDLALSSTAIRARETVEIVLESARIKPEIRYDGRLYLPSAGNLIEIVSQLEDRKNQVLMVGHNPGFEEFLFAVTGHRESMPTAALALIVVPAKWSDFSDKGGNLEWIVRPKELAAK